MQLICQRSRLLTEQSLNLEIVSDPRRRLSFSTTESSAPSRITSFFFFFVFFFIFIHRCFLFYRHMLVSLLCSGLQLMGGGVCWRQQTDAAVSRKVEDQLEPVPVPLSPETSAQRRGRKHTRETLFKVSRVSLMSAQTLNTDHKSFICLLFLRAATLILFLFSVISVAVSLM